MKLISLLPVFFLSSCGFSTGYLVEGDRYNSATFKNNYYTHWDNELKNAKKVDVREANGITSYKDIASIDPVAHSRYEDSDSYGANMKMNDVDDMFNYGYQSKLFDGQMVCGAQNGHPEFAYQLGRVQINSNGFSVRFEKESNDLKYFATQFKATTDNTVKCYKVGSEEFAQNDREQFHNSTVELTISLYTKNDANEIICNPFHQQVQFDNNMTNVGAHYVFLAFDLTEYNLTRLVGVSYTFTYDDELINWNKNKGIDIDYSVMLYEMFLPYTSWN